MPYRLVAFDFDGTLADSPDCFLAALTQASRMHGFRDATPELRPALRGMSAREIIRALDVPMWKVPRVTVDMRRLMRPHIAQVKLAGETVSRRRRHVRCARRARIAFLGVAWSYTAPDALQPHCATPLLPRLDARLDRVRPGSHDSRASRFVLPIVTQTTARLHLLPERSPRIGRTARHLDRHHLASAQ